MVDIVIDVDDISVQESNVLIANNPSNADVVLDAPVIQLDSNSFVLSSDGMYGSGNGLVGAVPNWLLSAVQQELTTGNGNITGLISDVQTALDTLSTGVTQSIASLNTLTSSQSSLITSLRSDVNSNNASTINTLATKVDSTQATAIANNAITAKFGADVNAFVGNIASTYVDANSSIAQDVNMIASTLNGISSSVSTIATATTQQKINPLWVNDGHGTTPDVNGNDQYMTVALAQEQFNVDANGVITSLILSSGSTSAITMQADEFKLVASGQSVASRNPFTVNATDGQITFNGSVSFNSVTDAPSMVASNTNINVTTNLVPNAGWSVGGYGDYQFVNTPTYYRILGAGAVAEDTLLLNAGDEVYTPYISDMTIAYKLSYSFNGAKIGSFITVVGTTPTSVDIIPSGVTVDPLKWYNVQVAVLPYGTAGGSLYGFIQESATLNIVAAISDVVLVTGIEKFLIGFVATADTYISRVGIETINANTLSSVPVTAGNINTVLGSNTTTINGGKITTGTITATQLNIASINSAGIVAGSVAAENITGTTITGKIINGGSLVGVTIDATSNISAPIVYGDTFRVRSTTYPNNSGSPMYISTLVIPYNGLSTGSPNGVYTGTFSLTGNIVSNGYSTGYLNNRICNSTSSCYFSLSFNNDPGLDYNANSQSYTPGVIDIKIQYSINGGTSWNTMFTLSNAQLLGTIIYNIPFVSGSNIYSFKLINNSALGADSPGHINLYSLICNIVNT